MRKQRRPEPEQQDPGRTGNISKERGDTEDSRATARLGKEPDGASTSRPASGQVEKIAEHERKIQHR